MSKKAEKVEEVAEEETSKEVSTKGSTEVSTDLSDFDFDADAGQGMEDMSADDIQIPRINIIQSLSPQRSKTKAEYINGCEEGQIFENGSKQLWDGGEGILVVPVKFHKSYLEWAPRDTGKGLVKHHGNDSSVYDSIEPNERYQRFTKEGNEIIPTAEYFVYVIDPAAGTFRPCVLSMSKSAIKHAKRWNLMANQLQDVHPANPANKHWNAPLFWGVYRLKTVPESNNQGEWYRWEIEAAGTIKQFEEIWRDLYKSAQSFRKAIQSGEVKVREPVENDQQDGAGVETDDDPM